MTFVKGPRQASFLDGKPAKLRFFLGYANEFAPGDGSNQVSDVDVSQITNTLRRAQNRIRYHVLCEQ